MKRFLLLILWLFPLNIWAAETIDQPDTTDVAFQFSAAAKDSQTIVGIWDIKPGYYLYRDRMAFTPLNPNVDRLGQPIWPTPNSVKDYPGTGKLAVYTGHLMIPVPVLNSADKTILVKVTYQGCSEAGYCYPPVSKTVQINLEGHYLEPVQPLSIDIAPITFSPTTPANPISQLFTQHNLFFILLSFFIFGLLLSLTPCVLPMIPILSSIIVGQSKTAHPRSFGLSLFYVLGMSITYAIIGIIFGYIGSTIQIFLQKPWIIILFSLIFIAMALSLFGFYELQLPEKFRNRLYLLGNRQKSGSYLGALLMGFFATLVLSPCVTPPLVGALGYIGQSGNATLGGLALFVMGFGMGIPLLVIGLFSVKLLPKAGPWMNKIKNILGILMLAVAIWMLARILPAWLTLILWALLSIGTAIALKTFSTATTPGAWIKKIIGLLLFAYGIVLIIGAFFGNTNPLRPLTFHKTETAIHFISVKTIADVNEQLKIAQTQNQPVLLDFYADWCISCKQMDQFTFTNHEVQKALSAFRVLRADVSANDADDQALQQNFHVIAPPTLLFFNQGKEIPNSRIVGEISSPEFLKQLCKINKTSCIKIH